MRQSGCGRFFCACVYCWRVTNCRSDMSCLKLTNFARHTTLQPSIYADEKLARRLNITGCTVFQQPATRSVDPGRQVRGLTRRRQGHRITGFME